MPKKILSNCSHCGRSIASDKGKGKGGFNYRSQIGLNLMHQISCPCGVMTKLCQTLEDLQIVWNSRPGKKIEKVKIQVKHPPAKGKQEGDMDIEDAAAKEVKIDNSIKPAIDDDQPF